MKSSIRRRAYCYLCGEDTFVTRRIIMMNGKDKHHYVCQECEMNEKIIADTMWTIRKMRAEGKPLTDNSVWDEQESFFFHTKQEIAHVLREIERRGFHWNETYADIPDICIVVD